ncbi:ABC transporter substrate-binding protein, partial [cf. Phormidesmis sp. LEGE 11477]|uniref:substrate-binding periplasmic protein n=1 Tax=cf. Phormidesmis sp. LEGE 11477 TaxID=1828680 RepID=UPI0018815FBC
MRIGKIFGGTLIMTSFFIGSAGASDNSVAALQVDGLFQKDGQGIYDQVFAAVEKHADGLIESQTVAPNRAFQDFESGKVACLSPANTNTNFYQFGFATTQSNPMSVAKIYIFTKAGSAPVSDLNALNGMRVGVRSGMPYGDQIESADLKLVEARTIEANVKKLEAGRIDAFIAYVPDAYSAFENMGIDNLPHAEDTPVAVHEDALLCRNDKGGETIVSKFNAALDELE